MPLVHDTGMAGARVALWRITETADELSALVPEEYAGYAAKGFASEKRRREWLAVRALLVQLLGSDARIGYDAAGKPFLCGAEGFISISHTEGYAAVALSRRGEVGLDIELLSRNAVRVARRFMHPEEYAALPVENAGAVVLFHWCAKEALFKVTGDLGGNFRDNIRLGAFEQADKGSFGLQVTGLGCDRHFVAEYQVFEGVLVVVCRSDVPE